MASSEVLIWGGGAIGGVIASRLHSAGEPVLLVDVAGDHVRRVNSDGLDVTFPDGTVRKTRVAARTPAEVEGLYKKIILCVKGQHTTDAATMLAPHLHEDGWVLALQNGLTEGRIAAVVGAHRTVGAHVNIASDYLEPGRIKFGGDGSVLVGAPDRSAARHAPEAAALMKRAFEGTVQTDNIQGYKWSKLCLGAMLFVTAMSDEPMADQFANPELAPLWHALAVEVSRVASAAGVRLEAFDGLDPALLLDPDPYRVREGIERISHHCRTAWATKPHAGIWRDLYVRRRPTEVDPQLTDIAAYGSRFGVGTPLVSRVIAMIREIENGSRAASPDNAIQLLRSAA